MSERTLLTIHQFHDKHPCFPEGGLRWLVFNEEENGMAEAEVIVRIGRKVLLDEERFFSWLDSKNRRLRKGGRR